MFVKKASFIYHKAKIKIKFVSPWPTNQQKSGRLKKYIGKTCVFSSGNYGYNLNEYKFSK